MSMSKTYTLRVVVRKGDNLNDGKKCDSRVRLTIGSSQFMTNWKCGSASPQWQETIDITFNRAYLTHGMCVEVLSKQFLWSPKILGTQTFKNLHRLIVGYEFEHVLVFSPNGACKKEFLVSLSLKPIDFGELLAPSPIPVRRTTVDDDLVQQPSPLSKSPDAQHSVASLSSIAQQAAAYLMHEASVLTREREENSSGSDTDTVGMTPVSQRTKMSSTTIWAPTGSSSTCGDDDSVTTTTQVRSSPPSHTRVDRLHVDLRIYATAEEEDTVSAVAEYNSDNDDGCSTSVLIEDHNEKKDPRPRKKRDTKKKKKKKKVASKGRRLWRKIDRENTEEEKALIRSTFMAAIYRFRYRKALQAQSEACPAWTELVCKEMNNVESTSYTSEYDTYRRAALTLQCAFRVSKQRKIYLEQRKNETMRLNVIQELVDTECTYFNGLSIMHEQFYLLVVRETWSVKYSERIKVILKGLLQIYNLHKSFYEHIQQTSCARAARRLRDRGSHYAQDGVCEGTVGQVLAQWIPYFKSYTDYVNTYNSSLSNLDYLMEKRTKNKECARFAEIVDAMKNQGAYTVQGINLFKSLLITPVQRIPRYEMLVKTVLKHMQKNTDEYLRVSGALAQVQRVNVHVNKVKTISDTNEVLESIKAQSRMSSSLKRSYSNLSSDIPASPRRSLTTTTTDPRSATEQMGCTQETRRLSRRSSLLHVLSGRRRDRSFSMQHMGGVTVQDSTGDIQRSTTECYAFPHTVVHRMHKNGQSSVSNKDKCKLFVFDETLAVARLCKSKKHPYKFIAHIKIFDPITRTHLSIYNDDTPGKIGILISCPVTSDIHKFYFDTKTHRDLLNSKVTSVLTELRTQGKPAAMSRTQSTASVFRAN